ncbi:MAG: EamA family transporter, partial [Pseudomonadota bacterium]
LMIAAGIGWAVYSLLGRTAGAPLPATAWNFLLCVPAVLIVDFARADGGAMPAEGIALAAASGALASGVGYAIWYAALPHLTATRAATAQLSVPAIAALGGALLLGEAITPLMLAAAAATLGGIGLVIRGKR